jgi:adenosylcobinamide kinase / adenosylcobinamide-phosphate guanylyltransferase
MERVERTNSVVNRQVILVTGGARSGKSLYAEQRASALGERRLYVATAEPNDEEMTQRIAMHRKRRSGAWITVEEPVELSAALLEQRGKIDCVLVDCLTLWLSNLLLRGDAEYAGEKVKELVETLPSLEFHVVLVTNEIGSGIVPDNALARQFRDLVGWANQQLAAIASEVVLTVAGLPMTVKKTNTCL